MAGLGNAVSVKFILENPWFKTIGAVVDYGQCCLRAPLHPDLKRLPFIYKQPGRGSAPVGHASVAVHQSAYANLSNMIPFAKVLNAFSEDCPHLGYVTQMVNTCRRSLDPDH